MTDAEALSALQAHFERLFPRNCPNCCRLFATLRDYIQVTTPLWPSIDYNLGLGDNPTVAPVGGYAMANCVCGSTLVLSSQQMSPEQTQQLKKWIRVEAARRGLKTSEFLDQLRNEIRQRVLNEPTS
jgi:hypothetical protein